MCSLPSSLLISSNSFLWLVFQIWITVFAQVCFHCTAAKPSTWLVSLFWYLKVANCIQRKFEYAASFIWRILEVVFYLGFCQNFEGFVVSLNHIFRWGMLREFTMLMEIRTIKLTCLRNFLMLILLNWAGSRLDSSHQLNHLQLS